jgi:hypothetical protein
MQHRGLFRTAIASVLLVSSGAGHAHHGQAGLFDESQIVELRGAVKEWSFINPHPVLLLEATDASGAHVEWDIYFGPSAVAQMRRRGFAPETFRIGETVIVRGHPARAAGAHGIDVWGADASVKRADGSAVP